MRKIFIAGNWKMNMNSNECISFFDKVNREMKGYLASSIEAIIFPSMLFVEKVKNINKSDLIKVGAQNLAAYDNGAYTGEVSAEMLASLDLKYVIVGHSERRKYFYESNEMLNIKLKKALGKKIVPILCIGESQEIRDQGKTMELIEQQLREGLAEIDLIKNEIILAYEPIWAIGTGKTATPELAEEVHSYIRKWLKDSYDVKVADKTPILYGGSVKPVNIEDLLKMPNIDGGLIGGASLSPDKFVKMIEIASQMKR